MRGEDIGTQKEDTWTGSLRVSNGKHHQSLEVPGCSFQEHGSLKLHPSGGQTSCALTSISQIKTATASRFGMCQHRHILAKGAIVAVPPRPRDAPGSEAL